MKRIFWLGRAFLLLTTVTVFGQGQIFAQRDSGAVLYPGEPPLTQGMVDQLTSVFEWILDARFTAEQRVQFKQATVAEWTRQDRNSIQNAIILLNLGTQLHGASEQQRNDVREKLQAEMLQSLRKPPLDDTSRLLLNVYESAHTSAIANGESTVGGQRGAIAEAQRLGQEATRLYEQGQYDAAIPLIQRALSIVETTLGPDDPNVATLINNLGAMYREKGDYAKAEPLYLRALSMYEKTGGPNNPALALPLNNLGSVYQDEGLYARAQPLYQRALSLDQQAYGLERPEVATDLSNLAGLYLAEGDYVRAEGLHRQALAIREKTLGANHPAVAQSLSNLAMLYERKGDYIGAEPLYKRALLIGEKSLGEGHPHVATILNNFAELYVSKGDYNHAEELHQRALSIREKALGPDHPDVASSLNNLALVYYLKGDYARAEPLFHRAVVIDQKALGPEHPYIATLLNNVALLFEALGNYSRAAELDQQALSIRERALGPDHPDVAQSLNNLALALYEMGDYARAEPLYLRAVAVTEKALGPNQPDVAGYLNNLALLYAAKGETGPAISFLERGNDLRERTLALMLSTGSEDQKRLYMEKLALETSVTISLHTTAAPNDLKAKRLALTTILRRKGRVLDAMSDQFAALRRRSTPEDRALLDALSSARTKLAALVLGGAGIKDPDSRQEARVRSEAEVERLEAQASARSAEFRTASEPVSLQRLQQSVPADAVLIELFLYRPLNLHGKTPTDRFGAARYVAYTLRREGEPEFVDLGEAAPIERGVSQLRTSLSNPQSNDVRQTARALDEMVMRPVRKLIGDTRVIFLSPDGVLNLVPFGALVDENDKYLIENYRISYLTSGRDLLRRQAPAQSRQAPVIIANPAFDIAVGTPAQAPNEADANRGRLSDDLAGAHFRQLSGTAEEASALKGILPGAQVLTEAQATEAALKQVSGPSILHIATHGFFLPDQPQAALAETRGLGLAGGEAHVVRGENPLLRSGLALAGVNKRQSGPGEDGVLTALEAAGLDLRGTKLVVLSACETGIGDIRSGEGVYGLRRALVLAGAESELMSLWQVSDAATRDLMVEYYKRLQAGEGRAEALRQSQLGMLRDTPRNESEKNRTIPLMGAEKKSSQVRSHPFYWASFIPIGDWRSLDGRETGVK
jgi:CHAT domain-containing protein/Tfp pilus assembly protein PilF